MKKPVRKQSRRLRCLPFLLAVLMLAGAFMWKTPQKTLAYSSILFEYTVKVERGYLALRSGQSYDKKNEIGELYNGETVVVCHTDAEKDDYWYVYSTKLHKLGYVNSNYLLYKGIYENGREMTVKVETGYLALRKAKAFKSSNEIGKLYTGERVIVLDDRDSEYWTVYAPTISKAGFVNKDYLVGSSQTITYNEPDVPAVFLQGNRAEWNWDSDSSDYLNIHMQVSNVSRTRTVTAFEIVLYAEDVWGNKIYGENTVYSMTTQKTIGPGEAVYSDYAMLPNRRNIYKVYAAVRKARLSDGTIREYRSIPVSSYGVWEITD